VAVTSDVPVGVDLEPLSSGAEKILADFAAREECDLLASLAAGEPQAAWPIRLWCAKEAAGKCLGTGLKGRPKDFRAQNASADGAFLIRHLPTGQQWTVFTQQLPTHIIAYTADLTPSPHTPGSNGAPPALAERWPAAALPDDSAEGAG